MKDNGFSIKANKLILQNGRTIEFQYPILKDQIIVIDEVVIVVLDIPLKVIYNENVFGISTVGEIIWQIKFEKEQLFKRVSNCPFDTVIINGEGQLVLFNWCDTAFIVNPKTGKIIDRYQTK